MKKPFKPGVPSVEAAFRTTLQRELRLRSNTFTEEQARYVARKAHITFYSFRNNESITGYKAVVKSAAQAEAENITMHYRLLGDLEACTRLNIVL